MAVVTKRVELTWLDRTYLWPIAKGMVITFRHFLRQLCTPTRKRYTLQYPDMKREMPDGYRGLHELKRHEDGSVTCVACFMCAEACPARCITIEAEEFSDLDLTQGFQEKRPKVFAIDLMRCIFCGYCEEACPKDAIW
ncbi:MAG TPA: NADH-quinone oxidoreductase subunit I, partial [Holophaga sp.]|nr:NADH-quinone oxidoreductase subunit I [Holophaga sp.]